MYPYIATDSSITVVIAGKPNVIADTHPNFHRIRDAIKADEWDEISDLVDIPEAVRRYADGDLEVFDNEVRFQGEPLSNAATDRLLAMMAQGFKVTPLINFLKRVVNNPDSRAVTGLYQWLERGNLPLTEDGKIIAYKLVRDDFFDHYTGKFDHSPGNTVSMPRFKCDPDPNQTCSRGLHFCSAAYLPHYGGSSSRIVLVKVDPADVVAFPHDYNISKGRCCRYEVVQEIDRATAADFFGDTAVFNTSPDVDKDVEDDDSESYGFRLEFDSLDDEVEIYDEDDDLAFKLSDRGLFDVADWMTIDHQSDAPFMIGETDDFDVNLLTLTDNTLAYDGTNIIQFTGTTEAELVTGLNADALPFPISNVNGTIRVRD